MPDHVHMLVSIPPKISVSSFMGYLKGKSALMMFDKHANLKYKFGNRHFWAEGYYVSTVGLNEQTIAKYIREQEQHDIAIDKLSVKEYDDPFKKKMNKALSGLAKEAKTIRFDKVKTSALRRWLVSLGLIARDQTTRLTGGYDCNKI